MARKSTTDRQIAELQKLTQGAAASLASWSERHLRACTDCPRNPDGSYSGAAVVKWLVERATDTDELAGQDSPNLERYRAAKADLAEMMAAERRGLLIP